MDKLIGRVDWCKLYQGNTHRCDWCKQTMWQRQENTGHTQVCTRAEEQARTRRSNRALMMDFAMVDHKHTGTTSKKVTS
ncbi:hypothetical protein Syun_027867 [Stephania yunnanensis]|uniref:Uncharacterized protein n=1 Tax=Stephania yunnanensis TaxID=152371 RepID=A0AAP0HQL7_9MAGN